jgi:magnesium transporter
VHVLTSLDERQIEELKKRDEFFWLDLEAPDPDTIRRMGELFGIRKFALEDTLKFDQRPKLEDDESYVFVVFYGARAERSRAVTFEVHLYISGSWIITVRREPCEELTALRSKLERPRGGERYVVYTIFDTLTDTFFPVLSGMDDEIDDLQEAIVQQPSNEELQRLFDLKRTLVYLRRAVAPQRDLFARAIDQVDNLPGLEPDTRDYFRDVYDHLIRISEQIDSNRDLLTSAMDVYLSTVSNRLNQVMKQLTVIATIFLPLTFVTGFFGQNFKWMVDHVDSLEAFLAFGIGGLAVALVVLMLWFRRSGFV